MRTLPGMVAERAAASPDTVALRVKSLGIWQDITWREYADEIVTAAHGLAALGVGAGDRVGILSENRPEWLYLDLGTLSLRAITVGFYSTNPPAEIEYQVRDAGVRVLVAEDQEQVDKILAVWGRCPDLDWVVCLDGRGMAAYDHPKLLSHEQFRAAAAEHRRTHPSITDDPPRPDDVATLVYTSGTTGPPKGAMLSVANIDFAVTTLLSADGLFQPPPGPRDVSLSFLPLSHVAERAVTTWTNAASGVVVHFAESIDTVAANLTEVQPTLLFAVPRIWEKLHSTVLVKGASASPVKRIALRIATVLGGVIAADRIAHGGSHTVRSRVLYAIGYPLVFRSLRDKLGLRKVRAALSGAAPVSPDVIAFFLGLGVPMYEVYGMTENCAIATANRRGRVKLGTVGEPAPGIELELDPDTGEILTRHPGNFVGYWNRPEATAATLDEAGWLHTGDVGQWVDGTHVRVVDRIKDIIITAGGKNISPSEIENQLKASPYVKEAVVIGDRRPYLTALIGIEFDTVGDWASRQGIEYTTYRDLATKPEVLTLVRTVVADTNTRFARVENIRKFRVLPKMLDHDDGELTATQKVRRAALHERFGDLIDDMYADETTQPGGDLAEVTP
ncbi:long-chain fatty acid--CoA ligase [Rhodococcus triatomae]|uniref:Acyl-CoA synthetase n=1 Tax=Rhodococcus triatomae TaxID=300028 RepID=A0A1G8MSR8_9NOCA|nr:AMP-binding protein [Rhodococcus triatomae]QNG19078.1 long-chain fatty acid--CoA ligase [Rhodococcus triatomae]QNG25009.1 long-chain fatty acid--CoA ligase [Rhodococcus triatomae]SDI70916.1 long-chain acyl-CoA synthetase [Rhodococcus triatomae]